MNLLWSALFRTALTVAGAVTLLNGLLFSREGVILGVVSQAVLFFVIILVMYAYSVGLQMLERAEAES